MPVTMERTIETDVHYGIGPYIDMYGHAPVTIFNRLEEHPDRRRDDEVPVAQFYACLDCGFVAGDNRLFAHEECDTADNEPIAQSWRGYIADEGFPDDD